MSQIEFYDPVKTIRGQFAKGGGIIMRRKMYRAPNGAILKAGVQESYKIVNPRDYKKTPPKGAELDNINKFTVSKRLASEIMHSEKITPEELAAMTPEQREHVEQLRQMLESFRERFYAQFKRPDPEAPREKKPQPWSTVRRQKQYSKLDNFIQAIIREKLQTASTDTQS